MSEVQCLSDKEKITVGEHLNISCVGALSSGFSVAKAGFKLSEPNKYTLKIFKVKPISENEFNIDFTAYVPAEYKLGDLILTDGASEINLSGVTVKVESVIKASSDGKPPVPYGSLLPIGIPMPIYYYVLLAAAVLFLGLFVMFRVKRLSYYKKLREKLKQHNSPITPDTQFYKSIRLAEKAGFPLDQTEKAFRLYNLRAYQLPMFDLPNPRIAKYFKRNFPQYKSTRISLIKILIEFEELHKKDNLLTAIDRHEFVKKLYRYVEANEGLSS